MRNVKTFQIAVAALLGITSSGLLVVLTILSVSNLIVTAIMLALWLALTYTLIQAVWEANKEAIREELDK